MLFDVCLLVYGVVCGVVFVIGVCLLLVVC